MAQTLSEKVWDRHEVRTAAGEPDLLYGPLHAEARGRTVHFRPDEFRWAVRSRRLLRWNVACVS